MCISALVLVWVFASYILRVRREMPKDWYRDIAVQGAGAAVVLLTGHAIRAFAGWAQFLSLDLRLDADFWANSNAIFLTATTFVLTGKLLMVYAFSRNGTRAAFTAAAAAAAIIIPITVAAIAWQF